MSKKERFFECLDRGLSREEAARQARIRNRQVRYRYWTEYQTRPDRPAPLPFDLPAALLAVYRSPDFQRLADEYAECRAFYGESLPEQLQAILDRSPRYVNPSPPQSPTAIPEVLSPIPPPPRPAEPIVAVGNPAPEQFFPEVIKPAPVPVSNIMDDPFGRSTEEILRLGLRPPPIPNGTWTASTGFVAEREE